MSISWGDRPNSIRSQSNPQSVTVGYVLTGTATRSIAQALAAGYSSVIYSSLYRSNIALDHLGTDIWNVDVTYGPYEKKERESGDFKWSFDTTGKTKHITQGYAHIATYAKSGTTSKDMKGAIGVTSNGVEGVDVPDKAFAWTEDWTLFAASYAFTYATILGEITGGVNDAYFRGFPAYTVRFDGASGGQSAKAPLLLEVSFKFSVSPTESITISGFPTFTKLGWHHLSMSYDEEKDAVANKMRLIPMQVDVDRVLRAVDFSLLGIGTS